MRRPCLAAPRVPVPVLPSPLPTPVRCTAVSPGSSDHTQLTPHITRHPMSAAVSRPALQTMSATGSICKTALSGRQEAASWEEKLQELRKLRPRKGDSAEHHLHG